jgi:hypothetical protein
MHEVFNTSDRSIWYHHADENYTCSDLSLHLVKNGLFLTHQPHVNSTIPIPKSIK